MPFCGCGRKKTSFGKGGLWQFELWRWHNMRRFAASTSPLTRSRNLTPAQHAHPLFHKFLAVQCIFHAQFDDMPRYCSNVRRTLDRTRCNRARCSVSEIDKVLQTSAALSKIPRGGRNET